MPFNKVIEGASSGQIIFAVGNGGWEAIPPGIALIDNGIIYPICSNVRRGNRPATITPAPAAMALFDPVQEGGYCGDISIGVNKSTGDIYATDGWNGKIRRLYKTGGVWMCETYAGVSSDTSGTIYSPPFTLGQTYNSKHCNLSSCRITALCVDGSGNVWTVFTNLNQLAKFDMSGNMTVVCTNAGINDVVDIAVSSTGTIYSFERYASYIWKWTQSGGYAKVNRINTPNVWDGDLTYSLVDEPMYICCSADGSTVYEGGGDESEIRRGQIGGRMQTLGMDYHWHEYSAKMLGTGGWQTGSPLFVDSNGYLYVGRASHECGQSLRRFIPQAT